MDGKNYENQLLIFPDLDGHFNDPMVVYFLKILLDPRVKKVRDAYVNVPVFKLPFIFATANKLPEDRTLRERFFVVELDKIKPDNKKSIIKDQILLWASLITSYKDQQHRKEEVIHELTKKVNKFIDEEGQTGSMRGSEEKVAKESMKIGEKVVNL